MYVVCTLRTSNRILDVDSDYYNSNIVILICVK